jgi:uncharacterized membrane protein
MDKTMSGVYAAIPYLPIGGFQIIIALFFALTSKDKLLKFHSAQALAYWLLVLLSIIPFIQISSQLKAGLIAQIFGISYILGLFLVVPLIMAGKALLGHVFHLPLIGKPIAKMVGLENAGASAQV